MRLLSTPPVRSLVLWAVLVSVGASTAMADATTHAFRITSAETIEKADCGSDDHCTAACMLHAELSPMNGAGASEIAVYLNYKNKNVDYADQEVKHSSLQFLFIPTEGEPTSATGDHVMGMRCSEVRIDSVEASCSATACPWIYIQIVEFPDIGLTGQKVEAMPE